MGKNRLTVRNRLSSSVLAFVANGMETGCDLHELRVEEHAGSQRRSALAVDVGKAQVGKVNERALTGRLQRLRLDEREHGPIEIDPPEIGLLGGEGSVGFRRFVIEHRPVLRIDLRSKRIHSKRFVKVTSLDDACPLKWIDHPWTCHEAEGLLVVIIDG